MSDFCNVATALKTNKIALIVQNDGNRPGNLAALRSLTPCPQIDTPFLCAVLGAAVVLFYTVKLYTKLEMKRMEGERREALIRLKKEQRADTPASDRHSVPVTPDTEGGRQNDDWEVQDY